LIEGRKTAVNAYEQGEITGDDNIFMALEFGRLVFGGVDISAPADSLQPRHKLNSAQMKIAGEIEDC